MKFSGPFLEKVVLSSGFKYKYFYKESSKQEAGFLSVWSVIL